MKTKSIGFIGGGRITRVFLHAFKNKNISFSRIAVFDPDAECLDNLKKINSCVETDFSSISIAASCDIVLFAIHPPALRECLSTVKEIINPSAIIISLAPKITIEKIKTSLGGATNIARVIPCANGIINLGFNPLAFASDAGNMAKEEVISLFDILGKTIIVEEKKLEAYALISAMGPTYFWFQIKHLRNLGMSFGLDKEEAEEALTQMITGSVRALFSGKHSTDEIMDLIPFKPVSEHEDSIRDFYSEKLKSVYDKIRP